MDALHCSLDIANVFNLGAGGANQPFPRAAPINVNLSQRQGGAVTHLSRRDKTRVAWHEVPGKKKKDASSPVGTVDQGLLQMGHAPFLGFGGI